MGIDYDEMTAMDGASIVRTPDAGAPVAVVVCEGTKIGTSKSGLRKRNHNYRIHRETRACEDAERTNHPA